MKIILDFDMSQNITPDTPVRINVKQLAAFAAFVAANTVGIAVYFDRRMSATEHSNERQDDRIRIMERDHNALSDSVGKALEIQNTKLDRLTDAINALAVNVAKFGATNK